MLPVLTIFNHALSQFQRGWASSAKGANDAVWNQRKIQAEDRATAGPWFLRTKGCCRGRANPHPRAGGAASVWAGHSKTKCGHRRWQTRHGNRRERPWRHSMGTERERKVLERFQEVPPDQAAVLAEFLQALGTTQSGTNGATWVPAMVVWVRAGQEAEAMERIREWREAGAVLAAVEKLREELVAGNLWKERPAGGGASQERPGVAAAGAGLRSHGRLQYRPGFDEVWFDGTRYDLRTRTKARLCLQFLVEQEAFDAGSARHLVDEIDPYVRAHGNFPRAADIQIKHYFNDRTGMLSKLRRELVRSAGRDGRYFLKVI